MITGGVACSVPGCSRPVVGQCPGYKTTCGKFYCDGHSDGKHCADCSNRKAEDDANTRLLASYTRLAEQIEKSTLSPTVIAALAVPVGVLLAFCQMQSNGWNGFQTLVGSFTILPLIVYWFAKNIWWDGRVSQKALELDALQPQFSTFYRAWKKDRSMTGGAWMALGIGAAGVAYTLHRDYKVYQTLDDIRSIRKSLDN